MQLRKLRTNVVVALLTSMALIGLPGCSQKPKTIEEELKRYIELTAPKIDQSTPEAALRSYVALKTYEDQVSTLARAVFLDEESLIFGQFYDSNVKSIISPTAVKHVLPEYSVDLQKVLLQTETVVKYAFVLRNTTPFPADSEVEMPLETVKHREQGTYGEATVEKLDGVWVVSSMGFKQINVWSPDSEEGFVDRFRPLEPGPRKMPSSDDAYIEVRGLLP